MFATRPEARPASVEVFVEDRPVMVPEGASAAAAVLLAGIPAIRETPVSGAPRLPYCMMGVCFDCLAEIDGVANRQACMVMVTPGMRIAPQRGARQARPGLAGKGA
ncbi:(2Fe-2S)-binding protein [Roseomonas sp. SSH11]|uniref:(2Fe-2S)-binding protein n=1 Tax=Pararoseomonas baculiformis TaxID=2820812 RepID=A0ABS4AHG5_9PROT|nr:(2Fe-2S)-binding protein [Pararoseomonas baculiformis]MBP0446314.1 (2Fe-2S)-binding protein [Pararoseomonas baculiformis]